MFLLANTLKFLEGGFVPLVIGVGLFVAMSNYHWGRMRLLAPAYAAFATTPRHALVPRLEAAPD